MRFYPFMRHRALCSLAFYQQHGKSDKHRPLGFNILGFELKGPDKSANTLF